MLDKGVELPCWLAKMAVGVPADVADGFATRLAVTSKGMARTLKLQHGTNKVSWVDIIVALQHCHNEGLEPDKPQEALKERVPAFYDRVADWPRIRHVLERVSPQCITALLDFNGRNGACDFPQTWFRQSWALLESPEQKHT